MPPESEVTLRLRNGRAHRALEHLRVCYEASRLLVGARPDATGDAERAVLQQVINLHRALQRGKPDVARRAAVRIGAVALTLLLDLLPDEEPHDPL